jgi:hypothetical protein
MCYDRVGFGCAPRHRRKSNGFNRIFIFEKHSSLHRLVLTQFLEKRKKVCVECHREDRCNRVYILGATHTQKKQIPNVFGEQKNAMYAPSDSFEKLT